MMIFDKSNLELVSPDYGGSTKLILPPCSG
jgi:hypothetical protein